MKAGTTSLFRWLGRLEEVALPKKKEIHFFYYDDRWNKGMEWYREFFNNDARLTGEASPGYTDPLSAETCAERILTSVPEARLIFLARHPLERARSHYRHWVQRGREDRPFSEAATIDSDYVARSMYSRCLQPYFDRFSREQLLVLRFEDLIQDEGAWQAILQHLGLPSYPRPTDNVNPTVGKRRNSRVQTVLARSGVLNPLKRLPKPIRTIGARMLTTDSKQYRDLMASSSEPVPKDVEEALWKDAYMLETKLDASLWSR